ncbi:hypothetical protein BH10PSE14_BH10PSE14_27520 [soil metagenome]
MTASGWTTALDFYEALLAALGAPDWHGRNVNALMESMIFGNINKVGPPMVVHVRKLDEAGDAAHAALVEAFGVLTTEGASLALNRVSATLEIGRALSFR